MHKQEMLNLFIDNVDERKRIVADYLKDMTVPYEDRKKVFFNTPEHLYSKAPWILHLPEFEKKHGEISWFDDFYKDRYVEVDLVDICKDIDDQDWSEEKKQDFITAVVNHGKHSFTLDW